MSSYSNSGTTNGPACSYQPLGAVASSSNLLAPLSAMDKQNLTTGTYMVPQYSAPGYSTLTGDSAPSCSGYFSITNAYKGGANCGTQYSKSACNASFP